MWLGYRRALIAAEFMEVENGQKNVRPQLAAALGQAPPDKAVSAVVKIDRLARDAGFVLKPATEAEKSGMGGFVFCDLPGVDASTIAGRMVLSMMASVAEFGVSLISERTKEALVAVKGRVVAGKVRLRGLQSASRRPSLRLRVCVESLGQWFVLA